MAQAKQLYVSQLGAGSGNGLSLANAGSVTWFNTAANWGPGSTQISPGDTIYLEGTITPQGSGASVTAAVSGGQVTGFSGLAGGSGYTGGAYVALFGGGGTNATANATIVGGVVTAITLTNGGSGYTSAPTVVIVGSGLIVQASGTAGNVTTIKFDTGASMQAPVWLAGVGAISIGGKSYITIDGGATQQIGGVSGNAGAVNGFIENTANGSVLTYQVHSILIYAPDATNITVQNLGLYNVYVRTSSTDLAPASGSARDWSAISTFYNGNNAPTNWTVTNCIIHDAYAGFFTTYNAGSTNLQYSFCTAYNCDWGGVAGDYGTSATLSNIAVHDNHFHDWANWDDSTGADSFHHNGFYTWAVSGGTASGVSYYNNVIGPNFGLWASSGLYIYGWVKNVVEYNNIFLENAGDHPGDGLIYMSPYPDITGTWSAYNNTFIGGGAGIGVNFTPEPLGGHTTYVAQTVNIENNLFSGVGTAIAFFEIGSPAPAATVDYNLGYNLISGEQYSYSSADSSVFKTLAQWQAMGFDTHGTSGNPNLNASYLPQGPSAAVDAATDLSGLAIFSADIIGTTRPQGIAWDIGAYELIQTVPVVVTSPSPQTAASGGSGAFAALVYGATPLVYQWQVSSDGINWSSVSNSAPYSGATTATLTITGATSAINGDQYRVVASNGEGSPATSGAAMLTVYYAPSFTLQPVNQTVTAGNNISFTANSSANPVATYQWQVSTNGGTSWSNLSNGGVYSGVTTGTLAITGATASLNGYEYLAIATNSVNSTNSNAATLTVDFVPSFSLQPSNQTLTAGNNASFSVNTSGNPVATYQWQVSTNGGTSWSNLSNGGVYSGVTTGTLAITGATASLNGYEYLAIATNSVNSTNSNAATLTVDFVPSFSLQPSNQTLTAGNNASFSVNTSGNPVATYQWQVSTNGGTSWSNLSNGGVYSGVTTGTLAITGATASLNGYEYLAIATNSVNSTNSNAATLTVDYAPSITLQPTSQSVASGNNINFVAGASGNPAATYQWQVSTNGGTSWSNLSNGGVYSGVTAATLTITGATGSLNSDQYRVVATNNVNSTNSNAATLTVLNFAPSFTLQPVSQGVLVGTGISFTASASGNPFPTYQWQISSDSVNWTNLTNSGPYGGVTTTTLTINSVTAGLNGDQYRCVATNSVTSVNSNAATLSVILVVTPVINSAASAPGSVGSSFSYTITAANAPTTYGASGLPAGLSVDTGSGIISGTPTTVGTSTVSISAGNAAGTSTASLTIAISKGSQTISFVSIGVVAENSPFTLNATASSGLPVTFAVLSGNATITSGNVLTAFDLNPVRVQASQAGNANYNAAPSVSQTVSAGVGQPQVLFGQLGGSSASASNTGRKADATASGSSLAAYVNGNSGTLVGYIASVQEAFVLNFTLSNGVFSAQTVGIPPPGVAAQTLTFSGTLTNGVLSGTIQELGLPFSAAVDPTIGASASVSGLYSSGTTYAIVGTQNEIFVLALVPNQPAAAGTGTVNSNGSFSVQTSQGITVSGAVTSQSAGISGTISLPSGSQISYSAGSSVFSPVIQPSSQTVSAGANVTLSVTASGATGYQWSYEGSIIVGATNSTLSIPNIGTFQAGAYTVAVTTSSGPVSSSPATVVVSVNSHLINLSTRAFVGTGPQILVLGFYFGGSAPMNLLIRGDGPGLTSLGVPGVLATPSLSLFDAPMAVIATDAGWSNASVPGPSKSGVTVQAATSSVFSQVYAFPLTSGSPDSAMVATLPSAGGFTAQVSGVGGTTGIALAELYDLAIGASASHLSNISGRAFVGTGNNIAVVGFSVFGTSSETVLLRGIGPALGQQGVSGALANPQLILYDKQGLVIAKDTGWGNTPQAGSSSVTAGIAPATVQIMNSVYASSLPTNSADCAMLVTLPPGVYTVQLSGVNGTTGVGLVEAYDVP